MRFPGWEVLGYLAVGAAAGSLGGLLGIGGAIVIVPALVYIFGYAQHDAQGTSLAALVPPIGLLAAIRYYKAGCVHLGPAALIAAGFFFGALAGACCAQRIAPPLMRQIFGVVLMFVSIRMIIGR